MTQLASVPARARRVTSTCPPRSRTSCSTAQPRSPDETDKYLMRQRVAPDVPSKTHFPGEASSLLYLSVEWAALRRARLSEAVHLRLSAQLGGDLLSPGPPDTYTRVHKVPQENHATRVPLWNTPSLVRASPRPAVA